jgi:hypothetical protein
VKGKEVSRRALRDQGKKERKGGKKKEDEQDGGRSVRLEVVTRSGGRLSVARGERVVGVVSRHDKLAAHDVELVLALERGGDVVGLGSADSEAELVVGHEADGERVRR